ncbi:MAG TPA: tyrosine-type recombinase/integrase [Verrucomicrobiae bacterium]|nr:tyrosine-type recombinase/integrase [Verrucomicrobiae bacterium]
MPLELRFERDGRLRPNWYGRYEVGGRRLTVNLQVPIAGRPPASFSLRDEGNGAFERSRAVALEKLEALAQEARRRHGAAHLLERIVEIKTGESVRSVGLDALAEEWAKIPRRRDPSLRYAMQCRALLGRFVAFVRAKSPQARELAQVTRGIARAFLEAESRRGVTAKTWNDALKLLRATFRHVLPPGCANPFAGIPARETETVFRKPFSPEELKAIVDAAKHDQFIRPILITGMCTAMRRSDCCMLRWRDVDLRRRFITVKSAKTGVMVSIPIFPLLHEELSGRAPHAAGRGGDSDAYVFPDQATMCIENPDGITYRVRKVLAAAGFRDVRDAEDDSEDTGSLTRSGPLRGEIHAVRGKGLRRASIRDFHSFRVTWVTLALTAGVPLELVQRVTGHKTVDIVLKHYFQPGREEFRRALQDAMPRLLTAGAQRGPKEAMLAILEKTSARTWIRDVARLRACLKVL